MIDVSHLTPARIGRRQVLGGLLMAPVAGMVRAAGWTPGNGPYAVGSSCMLSRPATAAPMEQYLIGHSQPQGSLYLDQLISDRQATPVIDVKVPEDFPYAGRLAGRSLPVVLTVFYPTPAANPRPDYTFPDETGWYRLPHMQRPGEAPLFADERARYPLIVHSGGQNTHGLWHIGKLAHLASQGYVVVDVYHGDGRAGGFIEMFALRSLAVRAALDHVLAHPHYADHVDAERIGASGTSAGGLAVLTLLGGVDPAKPGPSLADARIKAAFGTVPFPGFSKTMAREKGLPAGVNLPIWNFGLDFAGLAAVKRPWFAVSGEQDRNVPAADVLAAARAVGGPAWVVEMKGQTHGFNEAANAETYGWEAAFFDAHLRDDAAARALLRPGAHPAGPDALGQLRLQPA
ncbi:alpha/beta hydrolase family protein [Roseateles sp. BYS78W]|uniref:Alpha/beta hydrolase family protein n=1 Tax=Pelomonas candidula TaxID=3299025 RepID=A0ABW7HEZ6_9BURK